VIHSVPCWTQRCDGTPFVKELDGPPRREPLLRRPAMLGQARGHRWGHRSPQTRRSRFTGRLRRWEPCAPALVRYHDMVRRQRQPQVVLAPRQVRGKPVRTSGEAPMTLLRCQGISCDKAGGDGPTDRRVGHTGCHRFWGAEDHPCAHLPKASALAPFHDLSILQTGRWPPLRWGRGTPAPLARRVVPCSGGVQHGVPVGGPWIAGAQRHGSICDMRPEPAPHSHRPDPACR